MKALAGAGFIVVGILVAVALFMLASWIVMSLLNVPLGYYGIKLLDLNTAMALTALSWIGFFGGSVGNYKK